MPLLYVASLEHGHVSAAAQSEVAVMTGLTSVQVQSVASFYTMYKREACGTYLLSVCRSISCFLLGGDDVLYAISDEIGAPVGETSVDEKFSLETVECIGACGGAPALQVNYELVEGVVADKARELCRWLRDADPQVVLSDEMQQLFGGTRSFEWGPPEAEGAVAALPALGLLGTSGREGER